jgi:hypothetical protein
MCVVKCERVATLVACLAVGVQGGDSDAVDITLHVGSNVQLSSALFSDREYDRVEPVVLEDVHAALDRLAELVAGKSGGRH